VDDTLVGTASEVEVRVAEFLYERALNESVYIWKYHAQAAIGEDFLICEARVAPDVLSCLFLYAAGKFGERLDLIERVTSGKGHIAELVFLNDCKKFVDCGFTSGIEIPRLRIVTAGTVMRASCAVDRRTEARAVRHRLFQYIQYPYLHI